MTEPKSRIQKGLKRWRRGEPIFASKLNQHVDAITELQGGVNPPSRVAALGRKTTTQAKRFSVVEVLGDYLRCESLEGSSGSVGKGDSVEIAKPYLLRRTPFDGLSRAGVAYAYDSDTERTATSEEDELLTESQEIVPAYEVGDEIVALRNIVGGTGAFGSAGGETRPIKWIDMNAGGRAWAAV